MVNGMRADGMIRKQKTPEVVLFCKYNFHHSCMDPISKELSKLGIDHLLTSKRHIVYDMFEQTKEKFPLFAIADEWGNLFRDISEILITVGHSMASKNTTLDSKNSLMDYIYVPSQFYKTEFIKRNINPKKEIIITGYPAASKLFRKELDLHSVWSDKFISSKPKILFAPTYNRDLSLMETIIAEEQFANLFLRMNYEYKITWKLHPVLPKKYPHQIKFIKHLSEKYENIYYHENSHEDITNAILWADVVVGDCSGALFLALAGEKPVIAFDNPDRKRSPYYDETGPEWVLRDDYAYRITSSEMCKLPNIIKEVLEFDYKKSSRESVTNLLFENQTNAEKVIAQHIAGLVNKK